MMTPLNAASTLIDLDPERVRTAIAFTQSLSNPLTQWHSYLALLALEGFTQWMLDRSTPIEFDRSQARLIEPSGFGIPAAINSVYANQFHLGFIVINDVEDTIEFPISLLQNPAHFYVVIYVDEESNQIAFHSFILGDRLTINSADETCLIPISLCETNLEQLLWYLAGLELSAIPLLKTCSVISPQWLIQPLVNAAQWAQTQIDELTWTLFSLELVPAMRTRADAFSADVTSVFTEIERSGIHIPSTAQSGYRSITLNQHIFRLYVTTWAMEETSEPEWSLLVILESIDSSTLPTGTQLIVQEGSTVLIEEVAKVESSYLIAQIIGNWNEKFTLMLRSINPETHTLTDSLSLAPIVFQPY
ncbi:hypothetical protein NIES2135_60140 (plasmid) [Leptolyngbya boryana NIES-2135]|jgi:hypothetical protein|uniref:DUF1822 family protein n=1 Tax=Leptolyngbya boryana NIES-2135 TaxID=1973484 RepID=A0A1Z4JR44_LEPBY|nr:MULTISPECIES: DUF1822 family protein [Leptolyngbya]ULP33337.1 DUF1822 family protein [Leptolyngbya boryana IU 594]BAY59137.1 hypothetical protein NIES2135_60140 [Leptolyngbya boryana NIES-2135]